jgi:hypothetical protein
MKSLRDFVWEVFEFEALREGGYTDHGLTDTEVTQVLRNWYEEELAGVDRRFILAAAHGVIREVEKAGWDVTRQRLRRNLRQRERRAERAA